MNLLSTSQVLVKSHFFFILPFFSTCSSLQESLKILLCRLFSVVLILANIKLFGSLVFVGFLLVCVVFVATYAVGQKPYRQIGKT